MCGQCDSVVIYKQNKKTAGVLIKDSTISSLLWLIFFMCMCKMIHNSDWICVFHLYLL